MPQARMSSMYAHTLIIGGTGMLFEASVQLAAQSHRLTCVARTRASLARLKAALPGDHGKHHMLTLDWAQPQAFVAGITAHIHATEAPDLVVAWVHDEPLGLQVASALGGSPLKFFHVLGSAAANPARMAARWQARAQFPPHVAYCQVVLGAVSQGGHSRWLTHAEISAGVLHAVQAQQGLFVVGTLSGV